MNKDLDDRLIPNGEYRDAQNISVGRSESDNIGSLENILGNNFQQDLVNVADEFVIGVYNDEPNERLYYFITTNNSQNITCTSCSNFIVAYNTNGVNFAQSNLPYRVIVEGEFLNFSTFFPVVGINLIENLLFWTDNRNQPRVINTENNLGYYTQESDISVAKYSPYEPISLLKTINNTFTSQTTVSPGVFLLTIGTANTSITEGMYVTGGTTTFLSFVQVAKVISSTQFHITSLLAGISATNPVVFTGTTMTNKKDNTTWPGDPNYLEDRFVRFSYRYRYADGEYSVFAPFTQSAFIPKQKGYFISGDEESAYRSTILDWMENNVQNVELLVPLPDIGANIDPRNSAPYGSYKIAEIDILYKESDGLVVKVLDTISAQLIRAQSATNNVYTYNYQSGKPYKTLTEAQTIRVFDKIPTRALAQETSGNRIIYGNFYDKYSPPSNGISYFVGVNKKQTTSQYRNFIEYPNHSLKQNRNYQVGFVLGDKFGRQSSVILSNEITTTQLVNGTKFGSSTIFSPYDTAAEDVKNWFGDAIQVYLDNPITTGGTDTYVSGPTELGVLPTQIGSDPGLYAMAKNGNTGFNVTIASSVAGKVYTFTLTGATTGVPIAGDFLRGEFIDYVKVISASNDGNSPPVYTVTCDGDVNKNLYSLTVPSTNPDPKYCYKLNETGWYSYKIVVKQNEQEYYNAYLPGFLNGYPAQITTVPSPNPGNVELPTGPFPLNEVGKTANIVLLNDNINKIPRDLQEVGPDQKQFSSSVELYGRVDNTATSNVQFYPGNLSDTAISISTANDSNMVTNTLTTIGQENLYQIDTNPLIARISTSKPIGVTTTTMTPQLSIYETQPVESVLDLYWESSTTGLISDLNADINSGFNGAAGFSPFTYAQDENDPINSDVLSTTFYPVNSAGAAITPTPTLSNFSAVNVFGVQQSFNLIDNEGNVNQDTDKGPWKVQTAADFVYDFTFAGSGNTTKFSNGERFKFTMQFDGGQFLSFYGNLTNLAPSFTGQSLTAFTVPQSASNPIGPGLTGVNGASTSTTQGLKFSITSQVDGNGSAVSHFTLTASGALSKNSNTPVGSYTLTLIVQDTYNSSSGGLGDGYLSSPPGTLIVTVGQPPLNAGAVSPCIDPSVTPSAANTAVPSSSTAYEDAVWYLSDNVLLDTDFNGTNYDKDNDVSGSPFRLGNNTAGKSDLKTGTVVFSISMTQQKTSSNLSLLDSSVDPIIVYKRTPAVGGTPATAWIRATDINNVQQPIAGTLLSLSNSNINTKKYTQVIFAFEASSSGSEEYAVVAKALGSASGIVNTNELPQLVVNSQDLYNDSCVIIPDGTGTNYGTIATTTPKSYRYLIGAPSGGNKTAIPGGGGASTGNFFAWTPYGEYVKQFYTTYQLNTPVNWTNASGSPGNVAYDGLNNAAYPWNAHQVVTSTTPSFTSMSDYEDYNFGSRMTVSGGLLGTPVSGGNIANYGNFGQITGTTAALIRITGGASG